MAGADSALSRSAPATATNGVDVLGKMHERGVGLTVADRRSVGLARRVHQDGAPMRQHEPRIGARRGVALQMLRAGVRVGRLVEEVRHRA